MSMTDQYSPTDKLVHRLAFASRSAQLAMSGMEDSLYRRQLEPFSAEKPVFVVTPDPQDKSTPVAKQIFVTVGPKRGDQVAILKGIQAGETVVTSGQMKLKSGDRIIVNNTIQPSNDAAPVPADQ